MTTDRDENRDESLDRLFALCQVPEAEIESSPSFVAKVWERIWASYLVSRGRRLALAALVAAAVILGLSQWLSDDGGSESDLLDASYVDVLARESLDEQDEAIRVVAENGER